METEISLYTCSFVAERVSCQTAHLKTQEDVLQSMPRSPAAWNGTAIVRSLLSHAIFLHRSEFIFPNRWSGLAQNAGYLSDVGELASVEANNFNHQDSEGIFWYCSWHAFGNITIPLKYLNSTICWQRTFRWQQLEPSKTYYRFTSQVQFLAFTVSLLS